MPVALDIDYAHHPAFRDLPRVSPSCAAVARYFEAVDDLWVRLLADVAADAGVPKTFHSERARLVAAIEPQLVQFTDPAYRPHLMQALDRSADAILTEIVCMREARAVRRRHSSQAHLIAEKLRNVSVVGFAMAPDLRAEIAASLAAFMDMLRQARRSNGGARCFVAVPSWGRHWQLIKRFLKQNCVEEGISAYAGYPLELSGYALTYSHPDETWFRQCYLDIGLDAPKTVQMHFDEDNTSAKSMLYLNEIGPDNGPFSYIPRSAAHVPSRSRLAFAKHLDFAHADFAKSQGVEGGTYNRALFGSPSLRQHFGRLPTELQGSSCLGDDVLDATPLSDFLIKNESHITSDVGDLALFAGGETLHRGGIVTRGERWALQMIYRPPLSYHQKMKQAAISTALRLRNRYREFAN